MAIAFIAWLMAPAPIAWTSTFDWLRTTPAMAPATATGLLVAETLRISNGTAEPLGPVCVDVCVVVDIIGIDCAFRGDRTEFARSDRYFAYSTERVSRSTTTLIRPV